MRHALLVVVTACSSTAPPPPATPLPPIAKSADIAPPIEDDLVAGRVTLVDFWSEWCGACIVVAGHVAVAIAGDDRIVVRKVDVGDGTSEVARAHKVSALPHWQVYDTHRRLRYVLLGSEVLRAPALAAELLREP